MSTLLYRGGKWEHSGVVQPLGEVVGIRRDFDRKNYPFSIREPHQRQ